MKDKESDGAATNYYNTYFASANPVI